MNANHKSCCQQVMFGAVLLFFGIMSGCSTLARKNNTAVVVARRAEIRSSTAVVAAKLLEVNRGDEVEILESTDVIDPTDNSRKERWLRVKAQDEERTEGWIESRNVMPSDVHENARKLAAEDKGIPSQAAGQLRASSNLRLTPDRSGNENIIMRLDSGASFDITGWKRVPKPKSSETIETDVAPKAGSALQPLSKSNKGDEEEKEPEEPNELWYKVRLPPDISPAPAGWIYGKQVELRVPSDIIFYRTGREFVAWQRLDGNSDSQSTALGDKDPTRESKPGSWVILEKSSSNLPHKVDEPDFDRVYVIGYDKGNQEHYTAYRGPDVAGFLPIRVEGQGENKKFTVRIRQDDGQISVEEYKVYKGDRGFLKVSASSEVGKAKPKK